MKKLLTSIAFIAALTASAQNGVGINTSTPDESAALEIKSSDKGLLIPRMSEDQRIAINPATTATGLMVYQTDGVAGFYYFDGSVWTTLQGLEGPQGSAGMDGAGAPEGVNTGDMQYYNGTEWVVLAAPTNPEATLKIQEGVPTWVAPTVYELYQYYPELGGYVIELFDGGKHGLVISEKDQTYLGNDILAVDWYGVTEVLNDPDRHHPNARNFRDWRLPTERESFLIRPWQLTTGTVNNGYYWASKATPNQALRFLFQDPASIFSRLDDKDFANRVRAVRNF